MAYTEMVSALGYIYAPRQQATLCLLERSAEEKRLVVQIFGKDPAVMAEAAVKLEETGLYDGIDINMGCPAHKIAGSGEGSALLKDPELASGIMRSVARAVRLPVSVKMRLGWDAEQINVIEMVRRAEDAGIREITIHGRTKDQQYSGTANWDRIFEAAASVSVPVIGNGDLFTAEDAVKALRNTDLAGVMIARGAMGNPWIFRQIDDLLNGREPFIPDLDERIRMIRCHYRMLIEWRSEPVAVREMRKHISWYLHGLRGAAKMRLLINSLRTADEVYGALETFREDDAENA